MRRLGMIVVTAALTLVGIGMPATASADDNKCHHQLGSAQQLVDGGGAVVQEWVVTDLQKSTDPAPGYPLAGQLWEATASVRAVSGTVTPIIPNFSAVSMSGSRYPVLWQLSTPSGIPGSTIAQGQTSAGKVYFDVTGADPAMVIYATGGPTPLMMWCGADMTMNMPMTGMPMTGMPMTGMPMTGMPMTGMPMTGMPMMDMPMGE